MHDFHLEALKTSVLPLDAFSKSRTAKDEPVGGSSFDDHLGRASQSSSPTSERPKASADSQSQTPATKSRDEADESQPTSDPRTGQASDAAPVEASDEAPANSDTVGEETTGKDVPDTAREVEDAEEDEPAEAAAEEAAIVDVLELTALNADVVQPAPIVDETAVEVAPTAQGAFAPAPVEASASDLAAAAQNAADGAASLATSAETVLESSITPAAEQSAEQTNTKVTEATPRVDGISDQPLSELSTEVIERAALPAVEGVASKASGARGSKAGDRNAPRNAETNAARSVAQQEPQGTTAIEPVAPGVQSSEMEASRTPEGNAALSAAGADSFEAPAAGSTQHDARPVPSQVSTTTPSATSPSPVPGEARGIESLSGTKGPSLAPGADTSLDVERARFVQRVARAFQSVGNRGGSMRMRLSPPELGALRVEITMRDGGMTAKLEAETPQARTMLLENLPALRDRLAEQDIKIERFEVEVLNQSAGGPFEQSARGGGNGDDQAGHAAMQRNRIRTQTAAASERNGQTAANPALAGRLNVIV